VKSKYSKSERHDLGSLKKYYFSYCCCCFGLKALTLKKTVLNQHSTLSLQSKKNGEKIEAQ
jgi:hypothetical protein